jgi:UDPglucose 6-dehydrogenase
VNEDVSRISVVGCGYLGATHAACLAEQGFDVTGIDIDEAKIAELAHGRVPFFEPGLAELTARHVAAGRLRFSTDFAALADADVHFVTVGTPRVDNGKATDLRQLHGAMAAILRYAKPDSVIIGKSTVPVGTAVQLLPALPSELDLVWSPEFIREGHAVADTLSPDRIVVGLRTRRAERIARRVYARQLAEGIPLVITDFQTAELAKISANAFLATKISFINSVAEVCERTGADVSQLAEILGYDPRIGHGSLHAGIGYGGGCLPKDVRAFQSRASELGAGAIGELLEVVEKINDRSRARVVDLVCGACDGKLDGKRIAALGASFKPDSDDIRDSPALAVAAELATLGAKVRVYDPMAVPFARAAVSTVDFCETIEDVLTDAEIVVLLTEWQEFALLDPGYAKTLVRNPVVVDGRNALNGSAWHQAGWRYLGMGLPGNA